MVKRPPVVTIMGHVDHGKTTLLDALRTTDVAGGEAGGITQKISVFQHTNYAGETFTFIDTPGHAAFKKMRQRGSMVTDVVILVIAATEGVMPQTVESIQHIKAAKVPVIVAINKIDQPHADVDSCIDELVEHDVIPESIGGDVQVVEISALKQIGLDELVESLNAECELLDLTADTKGPCQGTIVEISHLKTMKSAVVLVQKGKLRNGDKLLCETIGMTVMSLQSVEGEAIDTALPGMPVVTLGWKKELPKVGDAVIQMSSNQLKTELTRRLKEQEKNRLEWLSFLKKDQSLRYEGFMKNKGKRRVAFMVQADCVGSLEVIKEMLSFKNDDIEASIIEAKVTPFSRQALSVAKGIDAQIICFNSPLGVLEGAEEVTIHHHDVIYHLARAVEDELQPLVPVKLERKVLGSGVVSELHGWEKVDANKVIGLRKGLQLSKTQRAEVQAKLEDRAAGLKYDKKQNKFPTIAGVRIHSGYFQRNANLVITRKGEFIWEGPCSNLRLFNKDVEMTEGASECGVMFNKLLQVMFTVNDRIECFLDKPIKRPILSEHFGVHNVHSDQNVKHDVSVKHM